jgi:hypothetical protein
LSVSVVAEPRKVLFRLHADLVQRVIAQTLDRGRPIATLFVD